MVTGGTDVESFSGDALIDPRTLALAKRVTIREDKTMSAKLPGLRPASVTIFLQDGSQFQAAVETNRGDWQDPYSPDQLFDKYVSLASRLWPEKRCANRLRIRFTTWSRKTDFAGIFEDAARRSVTVPIMASQQDGKKPMTEALISEDSLLELAGSALVGLGMETGDAGDAARLLVYADMFGIHTHGVERIPSYGQRLKIGGIKARPDISSTPLTPSIISIDGDNGLGPLVGMRALEVAMKAAKTTGLALVLVRGSNHFGPISPYSFIAAQNGFATLIGSNATTTIAPWGGSEAKLGNNPFGFGLPNPGGDPFMLDMAMSVVARAKIRSAAAQGPSRQLGDRQ